MSSPACHETLNYMTLDYEMKWLKLSVTDIKSQNAELVNMIANMSATMNQMVKDYDIRLKTKDNEILLLKDKIKQTEYWYSEEDDQISSENSYVEIKHNNEELMKSEISSSCEHSRESSHSTKKSFILEDNSFLSENSYSSKLNPSNKSHIVDKLNDSPPQVDEWTLVDKKRKDRQISQTPKRREVATRLEVTNGWTHLHLYNVLLGTKEKQVLNYIRTLSGYPECTVIAIKGLGEYASFKIGVPAVIAHKILRPENWSGNIRIKPWKQNAPPKKIVKSTSSDKSIEKFDEKNVEGKSETAKQDPKESKSVVSNDNFGVKEVKQEAVVTSRKHKDRKSKKSKTKITV